MLPTTKQIAIPQFDQIGHDKSGLVNNTGVTFARLDELYMQLYRAIFNDGRDMRQVPVKLVMRYCREICANYDELFTLIMQLGMDTQNFVAVGSMLDSVK